MLFMWLLTGIWTVGVLTVTVLMESDRYNYPNPVNPVTVVDTWFKGFVVIAALYIDSLVTRAFRVGSAV